MADRQVTYIGGAVTVDSVNYEQLANIGISGNQFRGTLIGQSDFYFYTVVVTI